MNGAGVMKPLKIGSTGIDTARPPRIAADSRADKREFRSKRETSSSAKRARIALTNDISRVRRGSNRFFWSRIVIGDIDRKNKPGLSFFYDLSLERRMREEDLEAGICLSDYYYFCYRW